jgi:hypothetical protein
VFVFAFEFTEEMLNIKVETSVILEYILIKKRYLNEEIENLG